MALYFGQSCPAAKTWSRLPGIVCTGIGCQMMSSFHFSSPLGGNRPAKLACALVNALSTSVDWTYTLFGEYLSPSNLWYRLRKYWPNAYSCLLPSYKYIEILDSQEHWNSCDNVHTFVSWPKPPGQFASSLWGSFGYELAMLRSPCR